MRSCGAYHRCTAAVVERLEGHVAKFLGDGVLAYFGWPKAHEDDAERAVRAGLGSDRRGRPPRRLIRKSASRRGSASPPGIAVVGDLIGEGAAREEAVVGDVPNLAARLQALAEPGAVVIGQATRRLVGGVFELDDLGPQPSRASPSRSWRGGSQARA